MQQPSLLHPQWTPKPVAHLSREVVQPQRPSKPPGLVQRVFSDGDRRHSDAASKAGSQGLCNSLFGCKRFAMSDVVTGPPESSSADSTFLAKRSPKRRCTASIRSSLTISTPIPCTTADSPTTLDCISISSDSFSRQSLKCHSLNWRHSLTASRTFRGRPPRR